MITDVTGQRFGLLVVLTRAPKKHPKDRHAFWLCKCDCGNEVVTRGNRLRSGTAASCGCRRGAYKHGCTSRGRYHPLYGTWHSMRQRCRDARTPSYKNYGGRGIRVCERWDSFENFLADMGPKPSPEYTLDRVDNDGHYEPRNCRWASVLAQARNKRSNHVLTHRGETMCVSAWAEACGLEKSALVMRLRSGWSVERALETPPDPRFGRKVAA